MTPLSLREARRLEAEARLEWMRAHMLVDRPEFARLLAARRATDEALVRAVFRWMLQEPKPLERTPDWSAVLDAVEREETER